jgi:hypothetical protein
MRHFAQRLNPASPPAVTCRALRTRDRLLEKHDLGAGGEEQVLDAAEGHRGDTLLARLRDICGECGAPWLLVQ